MHPISMNKTMRHKAIPLTIFHRRRIENKSIKQGFVLPCQQTDNNGNDDNKRRMVKQRRVLRPSLIEGIVIERSA